MDATTLPETRYALYRDGDAEPLSAHPSVEGGRAAAHRAVRDDPDHRYLLTRDGRVVAAFATLREEHDDLDAGWLAGALAALA